MSPRPLRQFYAHDRRLVLAGLGDPVAPFRRHRARFVDALRQLDDAQWAATTRCDAWDAKDVVNHLVSADGFFALTLDNRTKPEPTTFLRGFDPTTSPEGIIAARRDQPVAATLAAFETSTAQLTTALAAVGDDEWTAVSESPFGHVPVGVIAAHSLWDSWLHERDVFLPLGLTTPIEPDELLVAAAFTLFVGASQGGLLDDDGAVGDGPEAPIDARVRFDDLPGHVLRLRVDRDARVEVEPADGPGDSAAAAATADAGAAVELIEAVTVRAPADAVLARLPDDLAGQLRRGRQIL